MKDKFFVPYETAKRLKEKGYDDNVSFYYNSKKELKGHGYVDREGWDNEHDVLEYSNSELLKWYPEENWIAAPAHQEVIDWLEGKEIYVSVSIDLNFHKREMEYNGYITSYEGEWSSEEFTTREEALNAAIVKALELI